MNDAHYNYQDTDADFEHEPSYFRRKSKQKEIFWTTSQGETIYLKDMEDSHLQNTINYLNRKAFEWQHTAEMAAAKGVDVGEMIINRLPVNKWIDLMLMEIKRRQEA